MAKAKKNTTSRKKLPEQKRLKISKRKLWSSVALAVALVILAIAAWHNWFVTNYSRLKVERTTRHELSKISEPLQALGFHDLDDLTTICGYNDTSKPAYGANDSSNPNNTASALDCDSRINQTVYVPTDAAGTKTFNQQAATLSKALTDNGWKQREDLPTIPWFQKITEGIDYQPDQLNTKKVNGLDCTVDFFTAFAHPQAPRISLLAYCSKP